MQYGKYEFISNFNCEAFLPSYKGSSFRGVFGHALKKVVCVLKFQECPQCRLMSQCLYPLIFETPSVRKPPAGAKFSSVPHPFVIEPPLTDQTKFSEGEPFNFSLILFGSVNKHLPYFIYAFDQMGKIGIGKGVSSGRGRFSLKRVQYKDMVIYDSSDATLHDLNSLDDISESSFKIEKPEEINVPNSLTSVLRITVILETPLRFKLDNRLSDDLPFDVLVRLMLRRINSLLVSYGEGAPNLDYQGLIQKAKQIRVVHASLNWHDWRRYSNRQEQDMNFGGLIGSITYEGNFSEFLPLLRFSSLVHIGKQTTFGLGKMKVVNDS